MSRRRIASELKIIKADEKESGVSVELVEDGETMTKLMGSFKAPPDTVYSGGTYRVAIDIPDSYPFKPPKMKFSTKVWHPNISSATGAICLDILGEGWSPVQNIKTALLSLRMLLENPNPDDPQDAQVAAMMKNDPEAFAKEAREWAVKYAKAPEEPVDLAMYKKEVGHSKPLADDYRGYNKDLVDRFVAMGFPVRSVVDAFLFVGIDRNGGEDYELEGAYMGDITARLFGEI